MKLIINGQSKEHSSQTLAELIDSLGMKADRVAVELNLNIVPRKDWAGTALHDGDKLEIVHFVGGG
jgi:thiamine biosynthesis protein ThiS